MPSTPRTDEPRHMAGRSTRSAGFRRRARAQAATPQTGAELAEVATIARVPRSRLALALAVTVAALPILVLENLPGTPAGAQRAATTGAAPVSEASTTTEAPSATSTTAAPATTSTTVAPTATLESTTTTSTTAAPVPAPAPKVARAAAPPTTSAPKPPPSRTDPNDPATWDRLAQCESGGNWSINTGNGYYGGLQFSKGTWDRLGGAAFAEYPHQASEAQQIEIGKRQHAQSGWDAWPGCRDHLGYS